ncbi:unnamed protein product [Cylindrotheca closterium]|uniref:Uncharacterized protein n=1 Tax=Cylindrotheca closterium TaxID=2856 RepID=A0AAD2CVH7_9STRA|nr:unnamed protein product [Cylindrotheca closterium]
MKVSIATALCLLPTVLSFGVVPPTAVTVTTQSSQALFAKGFDKSKKPASKEKSAAQIEREQMSNKYDDIAASGGQEYAIFVRQFGGEDGSWLPCGSIAVPRGAQVSDAIFGNEEPLKLSIVRTFPKLKGFEAEFEYGYNLKIFPDDPVEVATKNMKPAGPSIGNWISNVLSPIDASKTPPPQ